VEQKIATWHQRLPDRGTPSVTDFNIIIKALKFKKIEVEDMRAVAEGCPACQEVGATPAAACMRDTATKR